MDRGAWRATDLQVTIAGHNLAAKPTNQRTAEKEAVLATFSYSAL